MTVYVVDIEYKNGIVETHYVEASSRPDAVREALEEVFDLRKVDKVEAHLGSMSDGTGVEERAFLSGTTRTTP